MKSKILSNLIIVFCFLTCASCEFASEDEDFFNGTMQAKVNDALIKFDEAYGDLSLSWETGEWSDINHIVGITDMDVSGSEIQIDFPFNPVTGKTYHPMCMYRTWIGKYYDYNNIVGYLTRRMNSEGPEGSEFSRTLTFTSITNKSYEGTFSFIAYIAEANLKDSLRVTDGKFKIASSGKKW